MIPEPEYAEPGDGGHWLCADRQCLGHAEPGQSCDEPDWDEIEDEDACPS